MTIGRSRCRSSLALTLTALLLTQTAAPDHVVAVVGGALVVAGFCVSLILDVRRKR